MTIVERIGVLAHPTRPQTAPIAEAIAQSLRAQGVHTWLFTQWDAESVTEQLRGTDIVITIGGDGAMLRSARVCAPYGIPVLGVNMGYLGFLTEIKGPNAWESALNDVLAGKFWIEKRMMLDVTAYRGDVTLASGDALNDAVIGRGNVTRMIRLDTYIDSEWTTTYHADALIVSTATGSTAYALASGGPILPPELRSILLVPVAPHLSLDRAIILPEGASVEVIVSPESQSESVLALDGELLTDLQPGDRVCACASENVSQFVRLREKTYFYRSLLDRMEPRSPVPPTPARRQL